MPILTRVKLHKTFFDTWEYCPRVMLRKTSEDSCRPGTVHCPKMIIAVHRCLFEFVMPDLNCDIWWFLYPGIKTKTYIHCSILEVNVCRPLRGRTFTLPRGAPSSERPLHDLSSIQYPLPSAGCMILSGKDTADFRPPRCLYSLSISQRTVIPSDSTSWRPTHDLRHSQPPHKLQTSLFS